MEADDVEKLLEASLRKVQQGEEGDGEKKTRDEGKGGEDRSLDDNRQVREDQRGDRDRERSEERGRHSRDRHGDRRGRRDYRERDNVDYDRDRDRGRDGGSRHRSRDYRGGRGHRRDYYDDRDRGSRKRYRSREPNSPPPRSRRRYDDDRPAPRKDRGGRRSPSPDDGKTPEERRREREMREIDKDLRTVFATQLPPKATDEELIKFFEQAGKVHNISVIRDKYTGRSKGLAYVEYSDKEYVPLALALSGLEFKRHRILVQASQAERNRVPEPVVEPNPKDSLSAFAIRIIIGNLDDRITERDLAHLTEPFGRVEKIELQREDSGKSKGFAYAEFKLTDAAKRCVTELNGAKLVGQTLKVGLFDNQGEESSHQPAVSAPLFPTGMAASELDDDGNRGFAMTSQTRAALMAKLGNTQVPMMVPPKPASAVPTLASAAPAPQQVPPELATSACLVLKNMFDPTEEEDPNFHLEVQEDVAEECKKFGKVLHIFVDKNSLGFVYLRMADHPSATRVAKNLHGRWFAKKMITAELLPEAIYKDRFPSAFT